MNENTGVDYLTAWQLNETIEGLGGIGKVLEIHGMVLFCIWSLLMYDFKEQNVMNHLQKLVLFNIQDKVLYRYRS